MKKSIVAFLKGIVSVVAVMVFAIAISGCQKEEGTMEKAGKEIDKGVTATKEGVEKAAEKVKEGAEKAEDALKKGAEKVEEKVKK